MHDNVVPNLPRMRPLTQTTAQTVGPRPSAPVTLSIAMPPPGHLALLIAGLALAASGISLLLWALFWDRSRGRRRCTRCGYSMAAIPTLTCPECGRAAKSERHLYTTRRRWRWAALAAVALLAAAATLSHRHFRSLDGGWWNAAPTRVLLQRMSGVSSGPRRALWTRIGDVDPSVTLARPGTLSEAQWRVFAATCKAIVLDTSRPRSDRSWASISLGCVVPDESIVEPLLRDLLLDPNCTVRDLTIGGVYPFYLQRGHLPPSLLDALEQVASDPACPVQAQTAANVLARTNPFPEPSLTHVAERIKDDPALSSVWSAIGQGMSSNRSGDARLVAASFLARLEASPDPAIRAGAATIRRVFDPTSLAPDRR